MATLTTAQIQELIQLAANDHVIGPLGDNIACWNWVLSAGAAHPNDPTSAETLYRQMDPSVYNQPAVPGGYGAVEPSLDELWTNAHNEADGQTAQREKFMRSMMRVVARANGFQIASPGATPYSIYMTVPKHQWFSWQHWALGFTDNKQTAYVQKDTSSTLQIDDRIWESERNGHITTFINIQEISDAHRNAIVVGLPAA